MRTFGRMTYAGLMLVILGLAQQTPKSVTVDGKVLRNVGNPASDPLPGSWLSYGRNQSETRYSTLKQINDTNAKRLGLAWTYVVGRRRRQPGRHAASVEQHPLRHHHLERCIRAGRPNRQRNMALGSGSKPDRGAAEDLLRHREPRHRALQRH